MLCEIAILPVLIVDCFGEADVASTRVVNFAKLEANMIFFCSVK